MRRMDDLREREREIEKEGEKECGCENGKMEKVRVEETSLLAKCGKDSLEQSPKHPK